MPGEAEQICGHQPDRAGADDCDLDRAGPAAVPEISSGVIASSDCKLFCCTYQSTRLNSQYEKLVGRKIVLAGSEPDAPYGGFKAWRPILCVTSSTARPIGESRPPQASRRSTAPIRRPRR